MDNMIRIDKDYIEWLKHVKKRFKNTQIKASIKVNDELLRFYWSIGKDIVNMQSIKQGLRKIKQMNNE